MASIFMSNVVTVIANSTVTNTVPLSSTTGNTVVSSQFVALVSNTTATVTITIANINGNVVFTYWNPPIPNVPPQIIMKYAADLVYCSVNNAVVAYPILPVFTPN